MSVWPLPRITFRELSSIEETRPVALLTTDEVWTVLSTQLNLPVIIQAEPARHNRDLFEYLSDHLPSHVRVIYAVGQGVPMEAGKFIAARNGVPLIIVPTALTSDAILTPTTLIEEEAEEQTHLVQTETGPASEIIIDWGIIQNAPEAQRGAGIVDVLSVVTGLLDWRYSAQKGKNPPEERFVPWAASVAAGLASQAIKSAAAIGQGHPDALHTLLDLMMAAVQVSNQLGHLRVREGSEHYLAQALVGQTGTTLSHAEIVGPCLLVASALHGQSPNALRDALQNAGVRLDQLRATDVRLALNNMEAYIAAYDLPYSILNDLDPESENVVQALEAAGLAIEADTWEVPEDSQPILTQAPLDEPLEPAAEEPAAEEPAPEEPAANLSDEILPADHTPDTFDG